MRNVWAVGALLIGGSLSMVGQHEQAGPIPTPVEGRLQVVKPANDLQVATPNDVVLKVGNYQIKHVAVTWHPLFSNGGGWDLFQNEEPEATHGSDGEAIISVHPPTLGNYELDVDVFFEDNKFEVASTQVSVRLPDRNPEKFLVSRSGLLEGSPIFAMDLGTLSKAYVSGSALYSGYDLPVAVDAASMQFSLQTVPGQQSPVDFDPKTGLIIARTLGQAVLTVQFGGFERKACINVLQNARGGGYSMCKDVVPGGLKWNLSEEWGRPSRVPGHTAPPRIKVQ